MPEMTPIPVIGAQAVGASYLQTLNAGIEWLLGQSHAPQTMPLGATFTRVETGYDTRWRGWGPHVSDTLCYCFRLWGTGGHRMRIQVDTTGGEDWVTAYDTGDLTAGTRTYDSTVDIAAVGLTVGTWYQWRIQIGGDGSHTGEMELWHLGERLARTGWQEIPAFTERTSAVNDFAILRGNVYVLREMMPRYNWPSGFGLEKTQGSGGTMTMQRGCYRYRPDRVIVGLEVKALPAQTWTHVARLRSLDGAVDEELATSGANNGTGDWQWSHLDIDVTSLSLTRGAPYLVENRLYVGTASSSSGHARNGYIARWSSGTPETWVTLPTWAHGSRQLDPDNLNALRSDLYVLTTSGTEEVSGDVYFHGIFTSDEEQFLTLVHRKRFLHYIPRDSNPAMLWYGADFAESASLEGDNEWRIADMEQQPVPYGMLYSVSDAYFAMESDDA